MPTVQRYGLQKVATAPLPGVRKRAASTPEAEGAGVAAGQARLAQAKGQAAVGDALAEGNAAAQRDQAIAGVGGQVANAGIALYGHELAQQRADRAKATADANDVAVTAAKTAYSRWHIDRVYGPDTGVLATHGPASLALPEQVLDEFTKTMGEIEGRLNPDQRALFAGFRAESEKTLLQTTAAHVNAEKEQTDRAEGVARIETGVNLAVLAATPRDNYLAADTVASDLLRDVEADAKRQGLGPVAMHAKLDAVRNELSVGVIEKLVADGNPGEARTYLENAKRLGVISADAQTKLAPQLKIGTLKVAAQAATAQILSEGGTRTEQLAKAAKLDDPTGELADDVARRLEHEHARLQAEAAQADRERVDRAYATVNQTGTIDSLDAKTQAALGSDIVGLKAFAQRQATGEPVKTNVGEFYRLWDLSATDPQKFLGETLSKYSGAIEPGDLNRLQTIRAAIVSGDRTKVDKELAPVRLQTAAVNDSLTVNGIDPNAKPNTAEGKAIAQLRQMLRVRVETQQALTGKPPSDSDVQKMADGLLSQSVNVPGSWWNFWPGGKSVSDTSKRLIDLTIADVPAAERTEVEASLRRHGRPVSDATVLNLYLETHSRLGK